MIKKNSPSGLLSFSFIRLQDVQQFRNRGGIGFVTLKAGSQFEEIPFSSVSDLNLKDVPFSVEVNVPTPENGNTRFLTSLVGVPCIFRLEMISATYYLGSDRFPCGLSYANANSGDIGQYAGYLVTVKAAEVSLFKEYVIPTPPVDPVKPPVDPVTPPIGSINKIDLIAAKYQIIGGPLVGAIIDPWIVQSLTNGVDPTDRFTTYNTGSSFIFENKYAFPQWTVGISTYSPSYHFSKSYNIKCSYVTISVRVVGDNIPKNYWIVSVSDDVDSSVSLTTPNNQKEVNGNLITYKMPIRGTLKRVAFSFIISAPFTFEVVEFGYIV